MGLALITRADLRVQADDEWPTLRMLTRRAYNMTEPFCWAGLQSDMKGSLPVVTCRADLR